MKSSEKNNDNWTLLPEALLKGIYYGTTLPIRWIIASIRQKEYGKLYWTWVLASSLYVVYYFTGLQERVTLFILRGFSLLLSQSALLKIYTNQSRWQYGIFLGIAILIQGGRLYRKQKKIETAFEELGLVSRLGKKIELITEQHVDDFQKKLVLKNAGFSLEDFEKIKKRLEAIFDFTISNIAYGRSKHVVQIYYLKQACPNVISYEEFCMKKGMRGKQSFGIGLSSQGLPIFFKLKEMVHLLVAGETSGGKSTFLRQMLTHLMLNNQDIEYFLVDLKGGIEFNQFAGIPSVKVISSSKDAVVYLKQLNDELDRRLRLFDEAQVNELDEYNQGSVKKLPRLLMVIDECAELFLPRADDPNSGYHAQKTAEFVSRLSRLSRAAGIHLVLATQRPDKRAIDPQIKDNLVTRLCFKVNSDAASILVLGNGKATDLPLIRGRAIWKAGTSETEVQVPYISQQESKSALRAHYKIEEKGRKASASDTSEQQMDTSEVPD